MEPFFGKLFPISEKLTFSNLLTFKIEGEHDGVL